MIQSKNNVPKVYTESNDYLGVLKLLDIVVNSEYYQGKLKDYIDYELCPDYALPYLASIVQYDYDYSLSIPDNRKIIGIFPQLIRNKGSMYGLELAVKTAINLSDSVKNNPALDKFFTIKIAEDKPQTIYIFLQCISINRKIRDLIEVVRPACWSVEIFMSQNIDGDDKIRIESRVSRTNVFQYDLNNEQINGIINQQIRGDNSTKYIFDISQYRSAFLLQNPSAVNISISLIISPKIRTIAEGGGQRTNAEEILYFTATQDTNKFIIHPKSQTRFSSINNGALSVNTISLSGTNIISNLQLELEIPNTDIEGCSVIGIRYGEIQYYDSTKGKNVKRPLLMSEDYHPLLG